MQHALANKKPPKKRKLSSSSIKIEVASASIEDELDTSVPNYANNARLMAHAVMDEEIRPIMEKIHGPLPAHDTRDILNNGIFFMCLNICWYYYYVKVHLTTTQVYGTKPLKKPILGDQLMRIFMAATILFWQSSILR